MFTLTVSLDSVALYIVALDILVLLSYILFKLNQKRTLEKTIIRISDFVTEYFLNTGVEVKVTCSQNPNSMHFYVLIESAPLKRFRFSNILERNLITHIIQITGNVVEKIYWRFPVTPENEAILSKENNNLKNDDPYLTEMKSLAEAEYTVTEVPWNKYEDKNEES
jgi:hypothetical protein